MDAKTMFNTFKDGPVTASKATKDTDFTKADLDAAVEAGRLEVVDGKYQLTANHRGALYSRYGHRESDLAYAAKNSKFG